MSKKQMKYLLSLIIKQLTEDLEIAITSSERAHQTATDKENIPENKYDTLALEAAYLAHGQSKRIEALQSSLSEYQNSKFSSYNTGSTIGIGALVTLQCEDELVSLYFIGPSSGGITIKADQVKVQVLTPTAPLGQLLMGKSLGDDVTLILPQRSKSYIVIDIQ